MNSSKSRIWVLTDGRAGNVAMALGLADRVAAQTGWVIDQYNVNLSGGMSRLPPWIMCRFPMFWRDGVAQLHEEMEGHPHLVIGAGRRVGPLVAGLRASDTKVVQILNPQMPLKRFDLIVAPQHDGLKGRNVFSTLGSVNAVTIERLATQQLRFESLFGALPRPVICVLIGGSTKRTPMTKEMAEKLASDLRALSSQARLIITPSRRTGAENIEILRAGVPDAWLWDGSGDNPYFAMLGWADAIIVTDDSVNMASESATTGKPVAIYPLLGEGGKIARFHADLIAKGHAQWFDGAIPTASNGCLEETDRAAKAVIGLF